METPGATPPDLWPGDWPARWHVRVIDETGSTNADLLAAAAAGAPNRSVLAARHQTAGRGRLDRRWEAPPGANLLVSLLFSEVPEFPHELTQRVALAARAAARSIAGVDARLKWPNDLLVGDQKLAGVLAQGAITGDRRVVVVGIGINVGWAPPGAARLGEGIDPLDVCGPTIGPTSPPLAGRSESNWPTGPWRAAPSTWSAMAAWWCSTTVASPIASTSATWCTCVRPDSQG
jgi:hypothetical protein